MKDGETIDDLVRFSGNFKSKAQLSTVDLERIEPDGNGFSLTSLNLQDANFKNFNLQNGDNIKPKNNLPYVCLLTQAGVTCFFTFGGIFFLGASDQMSSLDELSRTVSLDCSVSFLTCVVSSLFCFVFVAGFGVYSLVVAPFSCFFGILLTEVCLHRVLLKVFVLTQAY